MLYTSPAFYRTVLNLLETLCELHTDCAGLLSVRASSVYCLYINFVLFNHIIYRNKLYLVVLLIVS